MEAKDDQIRARVDKTLKTKFEYYARSIGKSQSRILRDYAQSLVDQNVKVNNEKTN